MSSPIFHPVMPTSQLGEAQAAAATVEGRAIVLCHGEGGIFALDNLCTHSGATLHDGRIKKNTLACPMHGARFDLRTGLCLAKALGYPPIVAHQVRISDGTIEVALSDQPIQQPTG